MRNLLEEPGREEVELFMWKKMGRVWRIGVCLAGALILAGCAGGYVEPGYYGEYDYYYGPGYYGPYYYGYPGYYEYWPHYYGFYDHEHHFHHEFEEHERGFEGHEFRGNHEFARHGFHGGFGGGARAPGGVEHGGRMVHPHARRGHRR